MNAYVGEIVAGVAEHQAYIDELLSSYSMGWTLERMPAVDRAILRIGAYELLWRDDIPDAVAVSEAVALATDHCFSAVGLHRIEINIRPENAASLRVVQKLGFRPEGLRERYLHIGDTIVDELYAKRAGVEVTLVDVLAAGVRVAYVLGVADGFNRERFYDAAYYELEARTVAQGKGFADPFRLLPGADHAIVGGPAMLEDIPVMVVGHQKGRNITERQYRNFAMAKPEGYRKAIRLLDMANRFRMPVITFVDTPAADPGVEAESRGISEAIAASMFKMFELKVPSISVIIGEGGSGGAIGIATASRVLMQEHAIYSVIPPEGCAAILWRDAARKVEAAQALKITAPDLLELGIIDEIVPEPAGGVDVPLVPGAEERREEGEALHVIPVEVRE